MWHVSSPKKLDEEGEMQKHQAKIYLAKLDKERGNLKKHVSSSKWWAELEVFTVCEHFKCDIFSAVDSFRVIQAA